MTVGPPQFSQPGASAGPYLLPPEAFAWVSEVVARRGGWAGAEVTSQESAALFEPFPGRYRGLPSAELR